jgi:dihydroflavonol-4-reductase
VTNALVTGASGFLGARVARALCDRGHQVRVLLRPTSDRRRLEGLDVEIVQGDVTDADSVARALGGADMVFHAAGLVVLGADRDRMHDVNVVGTRNVIGQAADQGMLGVHVSSVTALGPTGPDPVDESWWNPAEPVVAYEATKRQAHLEVRRLAAEGKPVRIGVPGGIYGIGDDSSMATLIETFVKYPTPVGYMPELVQSLVNVDDCADALVRIAELGADGDEFVISADCVTFREWFEAIAAGARRRPPVAYVPTRLVRWSGPPAAAVLRWARRNPDLVLETLAIATRHSAFSGQRARRELGWTPRPLTVGMAEVAAAIAPSHFSSASRWRRRG